MPENPYKTITALGKAYRVTDPYADYGKLATECFAAAQKREGYEWYLYFKPEDPTIRPEYIDLLKNTEDELPNLTFASDPYLGNSPLEIRERNDLLVITTAQFLDAYVRGEDVLPDIRSQGVDFAFEQYDGKDPFVYWRLSSRRVYAGWDRSYFRAGEFAVRAAVRLGPAVPAPGRCSRGP